MYYRISKFKTNGQDSSKKRLNSLSTIRHYGKRHFAVVKPVPVLDPREVAFLHFTEIKTIDRKKSILGNRPKTQNKAFLEFLGEPANKSTAVVDPTCKSIGVAASGICPSSSESSIVSSDSESSTCQLTIEMEDGHQERSAKTPSYCYQPVTETIDMDCEPTVMDAVKRRTNLKRKAIVKKINNIDLIVAMLKDLSLDDKRKVIETEKEHYDTFHAHRLHARPYAKRMKPLNS